MKKRFFYLLLLLLFSSAIIASEENFRITGDFPGGNIELISQTETEVKLKIVQRGTMGQLFYWAFKAEGAQGRKVKFIFEDQKPISTRGPAVSRDDGRSWSWLSEPGASSSEFEYSFGPDDSSVLFATGLLYTQADFDRFYSLIAGKANLVKETLSETERCRKTEQLRFGNLSGKGQTNVLLTARHHSREMTASHVLEGFLAEVFSGSLEGNYLLENVSFLVIPFMDKDGVEGGEEGKNRVPHDSNRDYRKKIYANVRALTELVPKWSAGKELVSLDLHCPGLRGRSSERVFFFCTKGGSNERESSIYFKLFEKVHQGGGVPYKASYNIINVPDPGMSRSWFSDQPNTIFAATLEIPFANSDGQPITTMSSREFGSDMAKALKIYLEKREKEKLNVKQ